MKNLVLKDIKVLGVYNIILLLIALISGSIGAFFADSLKSNAIYYAGVIGSMHLLFIRVTVNDIQNNAEPLINSMPVKRFDIVKSKYLSMFFYIVLILGTMFLSSNISTLLFNNSVKTAFNLIPMILIGSLILIYLSISIPFQFYDVTKTQWLNALVFMFLILTPNILSRLGINLSDISTLQKIMNLDFSIIAPIFLAISLAIYSFSLFVSRAIYRKKEF